MRAFLLAAFLAAPVQSQLLPQGWIQVSPKGWGGLDLLLDSSMIDGDAQVAVNVLTDNTFLEKRPGNVLLSTFTSGVGVRFVAGWVAPSGIDFLIEQSSNQVYAMANPPPNGPLVSLSTVASGYDLSGSAAFSRYYFADGYRSLWSFDGNSTATVVDKINGIGSGDQAPVCTILGYQDARLWCVNLPDGYSPDSGADTANGGGGGSASTVRISSVGGAGFWDVPYDVSSVADAPNRFDLNPDDGDQAVCARSTPWGFAVGKRNSLWIIKGQDNTNYYPLLVDPTIGCTDNRTMQMVNGRLQFLSVDGVYEYAGSGRPVKISRELDPLFPNVRQSLFSRGAWTTELQSDWATGTESTSAANLPPNVWDFNALPGEIFPSSGTLYDDNTSPLSQTCTSNINPANGLPWVCGVGFSSDTVANGGLLTNIDTTTVPLSQGYVQLGLNASAAEFSEGNSNSVWFSSFPAGNYTTIPTTWSVVTGAAGWSAGPLSRGVSSPLPVSYNTNQKNILYTDAPQTYAPNSFGANGWDFGVWYFQFAPEYYNQNPNNSGAVYSYGQCGDSSRQEGIECAEFDFISNTPNSSGNTGWSGYGVSITQGDCPGGLYYTPSPPFYSGPSGSCAYSIELFKRVAGSELNIAGGSFSLPLETSFTAYCSSGTGCSVANIVITRTVGGQMNVFVNDPGTFLVAAATISAVDATESAETANVVVAQVQSTWLINPDGLIFNSDWYGAGTVSNVNFTAYSSGTILSRVFDTGLSAPLAGVNNSSCALTNDGATSIDFYFRDAPTSGGLTSAPWQASSSTCTGYSSSTLTSLPYRYWQYEAVLNTSIPYETPRLNSVELDAVATGYYYSKVDPLGSSVVTWQQFSVGGNDPSVYNYDFRAATFSFSTYSATPPWTPILPNTQINLSTGSYAQFEIDDTPLVTNSAGASSAEPVDSVVVHWNQGQDIPAASATLDQRYLLCVTISTSATSPDTCLIRQKNGKWVNWSTATGPIGAAGIFNYNIVVGDGGTTGKVWDILQPNVYSDDGAAINSSWVSADFTDGSVFNQKIYHESWADIQPVQHSSVTFSFVVDKSSAYTDAPFTIDNGQPLDPLLSVVREEYGSLNKWLPPFAGDVSGWKYMNVKWWDSGLPGNYWRVNNYELLVEPQPRMVP